MRESPQDYFLNTKARFQVSLDVDDAAELYFACHNLVNHNLDFDWDDTLSKMEDLLKEQQVVVEPKVKYGQPKAQSIPSMNTDLLDEPKEPKGVPINTDPFRRRSDLPTSTAEHRSRIPDNTPSGRFGAKPACIGNGPNSPYNKLLKGYAAALRAGRYPLADEKNVDAVRELLADRAKAGDDPTLPDEFSLLNLFIENSRAPLLYQHLKDYYYPSSEFFVGKGDKYLDDHSENIMQRSLPEDMRGKDTVRFDHPSKIEGYKDSIGHLNPDLIGQLPKQMRYRLYERRYSKWLRDYNERFPDSEYNEEQKRMMFVDHWALELDGMSETDVWNNLYGTAGKRMLNGYLSIATREDYNELRDVNKQHGNLAIEMGLEALPFDEAVNAAQAYYQHCAEYHLRDFDIPSDEDDTIVQVPRKFLPEHSNGFDYLSKLTDDDGKDVLHFGDEHPEDGFWVGFSGKELGRFIKQMRMVNKESAANFFTGPENVSHNHVQPVLLSADAEIYKMMFRRLLKEAHTKKLHTRENPEYTPSKKDRKTGEKREASFVPNESGLYQSFKYAYSNNWNDDFDIPDFPMDSIEDVRNALDKALESNVISPVQHRKAIDYADADYGGHMAEPFTYVRRRDFNHKVLSPWIDAHESIPMDEVNSGDGEKSLMTRIKGGLKKMPLYPTHTRHTSRGGLGKESQDTIAINAQRYPHEYRALESQNFTMSDRRPMKKPGDKGYREFIAGLGQLGKEIEIVKNPNEELGIAQIRGRSDLPILSELLDTDFPEEELSEAQLQSSDEASINPDAKERVRGDTLDVDDLLRNAIIRHTGNLLDEGEMPPSQHATDLRGSLKALKRVQLEEELAKGSLGYIVADKGVYAENALMIPAESAVRMLTMKDVMPINRMVEGAELGGEYDRWRKQMNIELGGEGGKKSKMPKNKGEVVQLVRHGQSAKGMGLQAWIISMSKMFYSGKRPSRQFHTHHPTLTAIMRLNHMKKNGVKFLEDGCGMLSSQSGKGNLSASYAHNRVGSQGATHDRTLERTFMMKLRASLWGLGGTLPLHTDGVTVLEDPEPFYEMLQKALKDRTVPEEYLRHPSKFFEEGMLHNIFAAMTAAKGKNRPIGSDTLGFEEPQKTKVMPHWREAIQSKLTNVPKNYFYPLIEVDGKHYLELEPHGPDIGQRSLFTPNNLLHPSSTKTAPTRQQLEISTGKNPTPLDTALFLGSESFSPVIQGQTSRFMSDSMLQVPERCVIQQDGKPVAVGPHPAEFAAQWVDHVMHSPSAPEYRTPQVEEAAEELSEKAKHRAHGELGNEYKLEDEPDIYYRTGISPSKVMQVIKDEVNLFQALQHSWPIMLADYSLKAAKADESYSGLSLKDQMSKFEEENLRVSPELPKGGRELSRRRAMMYRLLQSGYHFMQGDEPKSRNEIFINVIKAVQDSGEIDDWLPKLSDAGIDYDPESGKGGFRTDYHSKSKYSKYSISDRRSFENSTWDGEKMVEGEVHPMRAVAKESKTRDIDGHDLLSYYLEPETGHVEILNMLKKMYGPTYVDELNDKLETLKNRDSETEHKELNSAGHLENLNRVNHHEKDLNPLSWMKPNNPEIQNVGYRQDSSTTARKISDYGKGAQLSILLGDYFKARMGNSVSQNELFHEWSSLFNAPPGSRSIMSIIARDLSTAKNRKGVLAFPELANTLSGYNDSLPLNEKFSMFANFFHCRGRWDNIHEKMDISLVEPASVPIGSRGDLSRSKIPCTPFNRITHQHFGVETEEENPVGSMSGVSTLPAGEPTTAVHFHPEIMNRMAGSTMDATPNGIDNFESVQAGQQNVSGSGEILRSFDVLTDLDLLYKDDKDEGKPVPVKAMHRIFSLDDLECFKGLSGDWVLSSWPTGERVMVSKKGSKVTAYNTHKENVPLPSKVREGVRSAHKAGFLIDCLWDGEILHIVDIIKAGDEDLGNTETKDRVRHLRANFSATEEVLIPAPINTKRVDTEGLERAVSDLMKEKGVKQVMLRDADSTYMKGETRHPKWLLMTKEHQLDVIVLETGGACLLGIGPLLEDHAKRLGNRCVKYEGEPYMDVGSLVKEGLEPGQCITVKTSNVTVKGRDNLKVFTLHGVKYIKDAEASSTDSLQTLSMLSGEKNQDVPHSVRVSKGSVHLDFPAGHVVYDTEPYGHSFIIKTIDAPNTYLHTLAESQREYWEPLAAVFLRAEVETKKTKKANVEPEPPANHDKTPKKVLKPAERLLKDPKLTKQLTSALETLDNILKEKTTFTGPKGLGIDYGTPVESPSGPTENTEGYNLPDHDPGHRQNKDGDCWCGTKKGEDCNQGMGYKMEDCPKFSLPSKEKDNKHLKLPVSS